MTEVLFWPNDFTFYVPIQGTSIFTYKNSSLLFFYCTLGMLTRNAIRTLLAIEKIPVTKNFQTNVIHRYFSLNQKHPEDQRLSVIFPLFEAFVRP